RALIVTGFYVPGGDPPAAETDGPPGALLLAQVLLALGVDVLVLTDEFCFAALAAAAHQCQFPAARLICYLNRHGPAAVLWRSVFLADGPAHDLSHLIAVERVGPSHTAESMARQQRRGPAPFDRFQEKVPEARRDRCHNMRGEAIDEFAGDLHRLFEEA